MGILLSIMSSMTCEIKTYSLEQLEQLMASIGQPSFRAKQVYQWLHTHHVDSYDDMTNLPKDLRAELASKLPLTGASVIDKQVSVDGTRKYLFELADGAQVEAVGIPSGGEGSGQRLTVCFSTQAGCPMGCTFCATGQGGLTRSLTADEMVDQVHEVQRDFGYRVSNAVAMGQGEPFLNYDETLAALRKLNDPEGLGIGARHMTLSSCGLIDGIQKLSAEPEQFTLAISLHAADQMTRDALMPSLKSQPLERLKDALMDYVEATNRRVTLEYLLIEGVNDADEDMEALAFFCRGLHCHVNLLPMNRIDGFSFQGSSAQRIEECRELLERNHVGTTVRSSRGADIAGACGQLKNSRA